MIYPVEEARDSHERAVYRTSVILFEKRNFLTEAVRSIARKAADRQDDGATDETEQAVRISEILVIEEIEIHEDAEAREESDRRIAPAPPTRIREHSKCYEDRIHDERERACGYAKDVRDSRSDRIGAGERAGDVAWRESCLRYDDEREVRDVSGIAGAEDREDDDGHCKRTEGSGYNGLHGKSVHRKKKIISLLVYVKRSFFKILCNRGRGELGYF